MQKNLRGGKKREKKIAIYYYLLYYEIMEGEVIQVEPVAAADCQALTVKHTRKRAKRSQPGTDKSREIIQLKQSNPKLTGADIGRITGTTKQNVSAILKRYNIDNKHLSTYKQFQADILAGIGNNILQSVDETVINKAGLKDRILSAAILIDKTRTIEGKSNINIALSKVVEIIDKSEL